MISSNYYHRHEVNIENGNIEFSIENGQKRGQNGVPVGWGGGGPPADDDRGCYDPVLAHFTPFGPVSMLISMLPFRRYTPRNFRC